MAGGFDVPSVRLHVPKDSSDAINEMLDKYTAQAMSRAMSPSNSPLMRQLSLLRTLKSLGLMNGFTDPISGEFIRTPGQKLTEKQQKEFLDNKHQREARQAVLNNEALIARLREADALSAEKRLKHLQGIKKSDIEPIAQQYGVKAADVYKGLFGELEQEYSKAKKDVEESSGLGALATTAGLAFRDLWEAGKSVVSDWSDKERIERAQQWNKERQAIIESDPYLADQAKREAEGEGYFQRMGGETGSILTNVAGTAAGVAPYIGATLLGGLAGPGGAVAAPFALGAAQGSFGLAQRAAADTSLTPEQQEAAVSAIPRLTTGALSGAMSAIPLNLGKGLGAIVGRGAARKSLQASMPQASAETIARELPEYMAAQSAARAVQHPVRNALMQGALTLGEVEGATALDVLGRNYIYNLATGSDTPVTAGLGEALAQGAVAALPFGAARYFQRPRMPEGYRLDKEGAVRRLSVDEYAERISNQYKEDPTNNAAMTSIFAAARKDLGNNSFEGLMGRVLNRTDMKNLSAETVNQWNKLFNVGRTDATRTATGEGRNVENDLIPGDTETNKKKVGKDEQTEFQKLQSAFNAALQQRPALKKIAAREAKAGTDEAGIFEAQASHLNRNGGVIDKALTKLGGVDPVTIHRALDKIDAHLDSLANNKSIADAVSLMKAAVAERRRMTPIQTSQTVVDATGRKVADSFNVRPAEEGGPRARPEQPTDSMGGNEQAATAGAGVADTTISGRVATHPEGTPATAADGTPVSDTGAGAATEGGGVSRTPAQNVREGQGVDVQGEAAGTPAAERGADAGPSARKVPGDAAAGDGAGKPVDTGLRDADGTKPTESTGGRISDDELVVRQLTSVEQRSPDTEFKRLNDLIEMKSDLMFRGAVGGYTGSNTAMAKRKYVAELMEGLYRTALNPDEMLPNQLRWKVSKYLVANKGVNPMSEGMAEGIHKLWNNADGISEREYLLNTLRDPDEQRRSILENVKCQMIVALRAVK